MGQDSSKGAEVRDVMAKAFKVGQHSFLKGTVRLRCILLRSNGVLQISNPKLLVLLLVFTLIRIVLCIRIVLLVSSSAIADIIFVAR